MVYFGFPAIFRHALLCLRPKGNLRGFLGPMHDGGLIAPVQQPGHGIAMRAAGAIGIHRRLVFPNGHGPKNIFGDDQYTAAEKTGAALHLADGFERGPKELRNVND